mmetsp:Transcript_5997/g.10029  ORF Transcript_5997/g.10029 Transcript_5997/m.10029 type:complete len:436 (-) Transcript_5997:105-1412(-)|eukprot:CAMPEP_0119009522 /NCGR_PEP_ID=MMETSP1176-20130426/4419_1 /TAXON_ID=265551 /ORGANISM="Synedropsis recta cf, Strain CCMP1620" /LENGTH=435 /DNA_ID=CAMNT_0006962053 /DNA_START=134 /DNA_END=1444 /DNA_ORIENTATION=+
MNQLSSIAVIFGILGLIGVASLLKAVHLGVGGNSGPLAKEGKALDLGRKLRKNKLRIAVFGGANAWGTGIKSRFKSYPYLLSPTVENFAHSSTGPNYFSVCTETVVGDDAMYDVIIFDYWLRYFEGLDEMARRLRQRYPHAIMIFVRTWSPVHFKRKSTEDSHDIQSFAQWESANKLKGADLHTITQAIENDSGYWYLPKHQKADGAIWNIAQSVKGYEFSFTQRETGKQTLIDFMGYFDAKSHGHTSELGHEAIADALEFIIEKHVEKGKEVDLINSGVHGHWGHGDSCHLWYFSGGTNMIYSQNMHMEEFDSHNGHFALTVKGSGWFVIENRMEDDAFPSRTLYIHYLTSQQAGVYPDAEINIRDQSWTLRTLNTVDPHHDIRTVALSQLPRGETNITITVGTGSQPFRLAGYTFSNEIAVPLEWGFGPSHGH